MVAFGLSELERERARAKRLEYLEDSAWAEGQVNVRRRDAAITEEVIDQAKRLKAIEDRLEVLIRAVDRLSNFNDVQARVSTGKGGR